jgi:hypothetical protein
MSNSSIAIVTPSFRRDLELCRTLNRTVLEFLPQSVHHHIIVPRRDARLFRPLADSRTHIAFVEEIIPRGYVQIPGTRRWLSKASVVPLHGWHVQQIVKIAAVAALSERIAVVADSDVMIVRDVDPSTFSRDGKTRLYRQSGGITAEMKLHVAWHRNACNLLGISPYGPPADDYIGMLISWDRRLVIDMCSHIEKVSGKRWDTAFGGARRISEYLLYGLFVDNVGSSRDRVWIDENSHCHTHWGVEPILASAAPEFVDRLGKDDVSVMIASYSATTDAVRKAILALATKGRLIQTKSYGGAS